MGLAAGRRSEQHIACVERRRRHSHCLFRRSHCGNNVVRQCRSGARAGPWVYASARLPLGMLLRPFGLGFMLVRRGHHESMFDEPRYMPQPLPETASEQKGDRCSDCGSVEDLHLYDTVPDSPGGSTQPEKLQTRLWHVYRSTARAVPQPMGSIATSPAVALAPEGVRTPERLSVVRIAALRSVRRARPQATIATDTHSRSVPTPCRRQRARNAGC